MNETMGNPAKISKSFWITQCLPLSPNPPLEGDEKADVAIIGGGYTGLSTAIQLKRSEPTIQVAVLEADYIPYGASGRNGGFSMTLFGLELELTKTMFGRQRTIEAHRYMQRAVEHVRAFVDEFQVASDYEHSGFLRVATTPGQLKKIEAAVSAYEELGIEGVEFWPEEQVRQAVDSPVVLGALAERESGLLQPARHALELKRIALELGVRIFEHSPVRQIERGKRFRLRTSDGEVDAERVVFATNAWSHHFPQLRRKQIPAFTHMVVTEPLSDQQRASLGWEGRQGLEDARNLIHYFRLTPDNRFAIGGSDVSIAYGSKMGYDASETVFRRLRGSTLRLFPQLKGVRFADQWGGPVSVTLDMVPAIGFVGDRRAVYSLGCLGHGVSLTQLNGRTIADLLLERQTDLTDTWFVGKRTFPWPPEPFRLGLSHLVRGVLKAQDKLQGT